MRVTTDSHDTSAAATAASGEPSQLAHDERTARPPFGPASSGEQMTVWSLWLIYGAFYFCRTNLSAAVPGMQQPLDAGGLGLDGDQTGTILAALKLTYGIGQLLNGQFAERVSPRRLLAVGMFGSAALNVLFGFSTGFYFLLFVWATNGYCQSLGWPPTVRVVGNWVPILRRGKALGIIGTGYQVTLGLTYFVAGQSVDWLGWRGAVLVPASVLAAAAIFMLFCLRDEPSEHTATHSGHAALVGTVASRAPLGTTLRLTFTNPALWLLGLALGLLNACRYGFLDWGVSHLVEVQNAAVSKATLNYVVLAIGAVAGSFLTGWATDRFLGGRRAPVICLLLVLLSGLTLLYERAATTSVPATVGLLVAIGFCIYGPQVLLVGTAPADMARHGTAAAAAGFVNFIGYMGAALGDRVTGHYKMAEHGGWQVAIYIWAGWALAAAVVTLLLWTAAPRRD
ncbi:MAG: MFS transporter [Pirellulales bacterium]|nr:MFS transporter [Pirellulales bacterium]